MNTNFNNGKPKGIEFFRLFSILQFQTVTQRSLFAFDHVINFSRISMSALPYERLNIQQLISILMKAVHLDLIMKSMK